MGAYIICIVEEIPKWILLKVIDSCLKNGGNGVGPIHTSIN